MKNSIPNRLSALQKSSLYALLWLAPTLALASAPLDNPVATHYGAGHYPLWTDNIAWDNVIDMSTYANGADNLEKFENARDELHAQGGGVLYYPAGTYHFDLPDIGWGSGNGTYNRGLMLKSGVVIRGADPAPGADAAVVRASETSTDPGFYEVTHNLAPTTVFTFPFHMRGKDPASGDVNAAGEVPSHWNFIGMVPGDGEANVGEVTNIGVVNVKLEGGFVFWGFHTPRSATLDTGTWFTSNWKSDWPAGADLADTWAKRVPDGTHYMDAIHGANGWHQPVYAGAGRLIFGVYSVDGAPFDDMSNLDFKSTAESELPADAFHSYRYTGRLTAHGTDIFIANNVLAKPTRNFVHHMLQRNPDNSRTERIVLFDYANHIGVDVNKSNYGGHQNDPTVTGPETGYHYPNAIVRDNWIFNRGNKGMDIAGQWLVLLNNHNERYYAENVFPFEYITNPDAYPSATPASGVNAGGISFDGWRWQSSETASDYMSRGYDIGGRNLWAHRNSVINTGSRGNDGEGIMAQRHNNIETLSWAFTYNVQNKRNLGPGTWGENGWIGIYDMHALGFLAWGNAGPGYNGIDGNIKSNYVVDVTVGPNLGTGSTSRPTSGAPAPYNADYQPMHGDPVNAPENLAGAAMPGNMGIRLTWDDASDNELGFRVERRFPGQDWQVIAYRPAQNEGPASGLTSPYTSAIAYPELNSGVWVDYTATPAMGPEYRVVAFNELDDDSTGVSEVYFADPLALKLSFTGYPDDEAAILSNYNTTGLEVTALTVDGDGSPVSIAWSQLGGPGSVGFSDPAAATTVMTFSAAGIYTVRATASDNAYSVSRDLTVYAGHPVSIISQPQSQSLLQGSSVLFSVSASGEAPLSYQWLKDGEVIPGAESSSLSLPAIALEDAGGYAVVVANPLGAVTSATAILTLESPPVFTAQPADRTAAVGTAVNFSVAVQAEPDPGYQWYFNGVALAGQNGPELQISPVTAAWAGDYHVVVTNIHGSSPSASATLTVTAADRYLITWNKEGYSSDGVNTWQSFIGHSGDGNSPPLEYSDVPLANFNGDSSVGLTFSQSSNVTGNNVGYLDGATVTEDLFTGTPPAWFDKSVGSHRAIFAFNAQGSHFEYTFGGFHPDDLVTFEFVLRRHSTGTRSITLVENPGPEQTVILNNVATNLAPYYPVHTVTGASSYTFRLISGANTWVGTLNAMAIDVQYAAADLEPPAPQAGMIFGPQAGGMGQLQFPSMPGYTYQLQVSDDLAGWSDVPGAALTGNGGVLTFPDLAMPDTSGPHRFYRIRVSE